VFLTVPTCSIEYLPRYPELSQVNAGASSGRVSNPAHPVKPPKPGARCRVRSRRSGRPRRVSGGRVALSLPFGFSYIWRGDVHSTRYVPCPAHTCQSLCSRRTPGGRAENGSRLPNRPPFSSPAIVNRLFPFRWTITDDDCGSRFPAVFPFSLHPPTNSVYVNVL